MGDRGIAYAAVLLALVMAVAALAIYISNREPGDSSAEAGFARDMLVHHAQAVEMATIVSQKTTDDDMRTLTTDMILTQQAQVGQMQGWLAEWGLPQVGPGPRMEWMGHSLGEGESMPGMASAAEVNALRDLPPDEADELFLRLMISHHAAAVPMAEAVIESSDRTPVTSLASAISTSQEAEIVVMEDMLDEMGAPPVEQDPSGADDMENMDDMDGMEM